MVARLAAERGVPCDILVWPGPHPKSDIEAAARQARYRLMIEAAIARHASHLLLAHHQDDVAETMLMRLARGSGAFGLAAMRPVIALEALSVVRPFLSVPHVRLMATTRQAGLTPVDDPMNADAKFARARLREAMPMLADLGIDPAGLAATARRLADAADAIDACVTGMMRTVAAFDELGVVRLAIDDFAVAPAAVRRRMLARLLAAAGGNAPWPRFERLARLEEAILAGGAWRRTLAGAVIAVQDDKVIFQREIGRTGLPEKTVTAAGTVDWDQRFRITFVGEVPAATVVGALGEDGRASIGAQKAPPDVLATLPAVRVAGQLRAAPSIDFHNAPGPQATVTCQVARRALAPPLFPDFMSRDA